MKTRKLRDIQVSEIGMGCMGFSHGYGQIPEEKYSIEAIRMAYDEGGCTFFDTAEGYSPNLQGFGHNELILGKALEPIRKDVVIATKLYVPTEEAAAKGVYQTIKDHLIASMKCLRTDYVDLYYLHRINEEIESEEVADAMGRLINEGVIRGWGLSAVDTPMIARLNAVTPLSAVQNIYSMVERGIEKSVLPYCVENNIGVVPFSPIASGLLSGKVTTKTVFEENDDVRKFVPQLSKENLAANQPIVELLHKYARMKDATPAQISLAWMLYKWPNVVPIPGSKNKERILENLGAANVTLTKEEFEALDSALNSMEVHGHRGFDETTQHNAFRDKIEEENKKKNG